MPIIRRILALGTLFASLWAPSASALATELIVNGGFETGTLAGWTTSGLTVPGACGGGPNATDWTVSNVGTATNCANPGNPPVGSFAAYNMFDAGAPTTYRLRQALALPAGLTAATLSWRDSITDGHVGAPRVFSINVWNAAGTILLTTLYSYNSAATTTGWVTHSVNTTAALAPLAGQNILLEFAASIPAGWTGGAGMGLDAVSLDATASVSVPTLSEWGLILLSMMMLAGAYWHSRRSAAIRWPK